MRVMDGTGDFARFHDPLDPNYPLSTDGGFNIYLTNPNNQFESMYISGDYNCVPFDVFGEGDGTPCLFIGSVTYLNFTGIPDDWPDPVSFQANNCSPSIDGPSIIEVIHEGITRDADGNFIKVSFLLRTIRGDLRFEFRP
ncbi:hypothetical protein PX52LOC_01728 [Limnoglobus roseus]|uniref:Uncharacterized protein n=2 Tax=Limnoglobus roseus TaxID=2598579 RepID=A0A5C1A7W2_9BACT|nr:hypothetical protein PX52LOC_01728 [Limnoglobus roseus]